MDHNVRQAREVAGSYSPQAALAGAMLGAVAIIGGLTFIGWLAGRGRLLKQGEYDHLEDHVQQGEALLSVVCDTADGAARTRDVLEQAHATEVRTEDTGESV